MFYQYSKRMVFNAVALFLVVAAGCASNHPIPSPGKDVYGADQVQQFDKETRPVDGAGFYDEYVIGVGDRLDVIFLFHSNLTTRELLVRRDGKISLPYVDDHIAAGLTPMTLDSLLTVRYSKILRDPNLSVIVTSPADQMVYVLGEVSSPGGYKFTTPITLVQSVARAGGLTEKSNASHAVLIRREGVNRIVGVEVNIKDIFTGKQIGNDIGLRNMDIVYVPKSRLHSTADFAKTFNEILNIPIDWAWKSWQIANLSAQYEFWQSNDQSPNTPNTP